MWHAIQGVWSGSRCHFRGIDKSQLDPMIFLAQLSHRRAKFVESTSVSSWILIRFNWLAIVAGNRASRLMETFDSLLFSSCSNLHGRDKIAAICGGRFAP